MYVLTEVIGRGIGLIIKDIGKPSKTPALAADNQSLQLAANFCLATKIEYNASVYLPNLAVIQKISA